MPTKDSLSAPASLRSGRAVISAGQVDASAIGRGMEAVGRGVGQIGAAVSAIDDKAKREQDALDLIRAESAQRAALFETERGFDNDGDYGSHDRRYVPLARQATDQAAGLIRDPQKREMWRLKADTDILAGRQRLIDRADRMGKQERIVGLETELEGYRNSFTDPNATSEDRARIIQQTRDAIELGKRSGMIDPVTARKFDNDYVRGAVKQDAERRLLEDPDGLRRELHGGRDVPMPLDDMENPETRGRPGSRPSGLREAGNIDLGSRPRVKNADGSVSTIRSISVNIDGEEVLIPTISDDGKVLSEEQAIAQYNKTGKHLGKFDTPENATLFAERLSESQGRKPASFTDFARGKGRPASNAVPAAAPAVGPGREESGRFMVEGLDIKDRVDPNAQYGRAATADAQPFTGIVLHHTGGDGADKFIKYGQSVDRERGGAFGYHFYIDKDGSIYQGAPMDARTNHVKPPSARERRDATGLANENAIGISLLGSGGDETPQQLAAVKQLADSLSQTYGIAGNRIVGHGDLQHDRQSREGQAALKAIRGEISPGDVAKNEAAWPFSMLSPLERAELLKKAETAIRTKREGQKTFAQQALDDDVESIRATGQGAEPDLDAAKSILPPEALNRYFLKRTEAEMEHRGTSDLYALPEEELQNRLSDERAVGGLKPAAGEAMFEAKQRIFEKAERKVNELRGLRERDPARAVDEFPEVAQAVEAVNAAPDDPEALQGLVRARLDSQRKIGVPDGLQSPITKAEARELVAPLQGVEAEMMEKSAIKWYTDLQQRYGSYGKSVAKSAMEYALTRDSTTAQMVTGQIESLAKGERVSAASIRRTEYLLEANRALGAYGGDFVGEPARQMASGVQREGGESFNIAAPRTGGKAGPDDALPGQAYLGDTDPNQIFFDDTGGAHIQGRYIPPDAIKMLTDNPALAPRFNKHYGNDIAETILAGMMSPNG